MGQNSQDIAYNLGQMGSAYTDLAKPIVPPAGLVIVAITFLDDNTPTVLTSEKLDRHGPNFINIQGTSGDIQVADQFANFNGIHASDIPDVNRNAGNDVTLTTGSDKVQVGQYVLLVNQGDTDTTGITIDAETPVPIIQGPNKQGVRVTEVQDETTIVLDGDITPSTQGLIFLDSVHGAGGLTVSGQVFPKGITIYGRWTHFTPSAAGVICYFGI
tara:strand:+ start:1061 stop:1705 length:645 start_codon:yes stop_codon:yes gene_type:complete